MEQSVSWPVGVAVAGGLMTAVGVLWQIVLKGMQETRSKLEHCEIKHEEQAAKVESLAVKFSYLEGRMAERNETVEQLRDMQSGIGELSQAVLKLVHQTKDVTEGE